MRQIKNTDQHTTFLYVESRCPTAIFVTYFGVCRKAVDEASGEIMGMGKWNIYNNSLPDLDTIKPLGDYWDNDEEKMFATSMTQIFLQERNAAIKRSNGNLVSLDILAIDPKYQRKGAGDALVKWGTRKADELGLEAVVESSVFGKGLYEKNGFVFVKDVVTRPPEGEERWKGRTAGQFAWLIRPKKH